MLNHPTPHPDLAGYTLGILEPGESEAFEAHLDHCDTCRSEVRELEALPDLIATALPTSQAPADLQVQTFAAIERELRTHSRRTGLRRLAVAAMIAAVFVAGGFVVRQRIGARSPATTIALVAPDTGGARGLLHVHSTPSGVAVGLEVEGLPPTSTGRHYELWFVGPGDSLQKPNRISAGTFVVGSDGKAKVQMFSAASLARYPKVGITDEPNDGNPVRTGPKVLASKPAPPPKVRLQASLRPEEEVLSPGPPGANGTAIVDVDAKGGELCYSLTYAGVGQAAMVHIHQGPQGVGGRPVLIDLEVTKNGDRACVAAEPVVLQGIVANPADYFANIHTQDYPTGAIRGQLERAHR
jgi:anti-sigma-K factor RskA